MWWRRISTSSRASISYLQRQWEGVDYLDGFDELEEERGEFVVSAKGGSGDGDDRGDSFS